MKSIRRLLKPVYILFLSFFILADGYSLTFEGIEFPDGAQVAGKQLILNGVGLRQASIFKVNVYAAGFYSEKKSTLASDHLKLDSPKRLVLHFMRDLGAEKLRLAFKEGFDVCFEKGVACDSAKAGLIQLSGSLTDMTTGDVLVLEWLNDQVRVQVGRANADNIKGKAFAQQLLSVWLGSKPPSEKLKAGLLGVKPQ